MAHATFLGLRIIAMYGAYRAKRKLLPYPHGMPVAIESGVHLLVARLAKLPNSAEKSLPDM